MKEGIEFLVVLVLFGGKLGFRYDLDIEWLF